ncbi:hypothetical protein CC1G_04555 [Coprinopsis cinerea okayama7|uniref:Xylanolytic transcriptional activator regulatory domain-containing protein n=1 Tax=Coprinopsis cinerea (strain Okayama-7 / 130 / ATCC MYA-4618 / FGSC 9003) TaxID=240176 RepID=A8N5H7_COPC7|nr:hypothetical protein CC1G_04555 [Coprinopsis cinerea okayama7\|eukprot:XP_001830122.2 hypothetical protein CC1G_04555 [Coprinopsis cinerea okayama7\
MARGHGTTSAQTAFRQKSNVPISTHREASKPRGPPKAYVTGLEDRVEELEALLAQIRPNTDFSDELGPPIVRDSWKNPEDRSRPASSSPVPPQPSHSPPSRQSPASSPPAASPLPPLMIPFHRPNRESSDTHSVSSRTTHLIFKPRRGLKKSKSNASSVYTVSSNSGSSAITASPEYRSPSSYPSSSESEDTFEEGSSSGPEELLESSAGGRTRLGLKMNETPAVENNRILFHGRSSTAGLVETTRKFKHMHMQEAMKMDIAEDEPLRESVKKEEVDSKGKETKVKVQGPDNSRVAMTRRPTYWQTPPWELKYQALHGSSPLTSIPHILAGFPPPDLCLTLIKLYFFHSNNHYPLLHRPTFDRQWEEKLYERNVWFASVCLFIFAVASRWCEDERVLEESLSEREARELGKGEAPDPNCKDWTRAGWKYFEYGAEIHRIGRSLFYPASLFEVQSFTLMGMFLRGTRYAPAAWSVVSIGLRKAIDVGAHRKSVYQQKHNADDELWKRAFWHLVVFDRIGGVILGRGIGLSEEDFDAELPLEVDDQFWNGTWKQPPDVPARVASFNQLIKLTQIIAFTSKTVYGINKPKIFRHLIEGDWRVEVIQQLSTALKEWREAVPPHLQWSDQITDPVFFTQSAMLYTTYHLITMLIFRPFIPMPPLLPPSLQRDSKVKESASSPPSPFPFPALKNCISSACACARIVEVQFRKRSWDYIHIPGFVNTAFTCAGVLLLAVWDLKAQQKVLIKVKQAGVISSPQEGGLGDPSTTGADEKVDGLLLALNEKMEGLAADAKMLLSAIEWVQDRWELAQSFASRLKESLPSEEDLRCNPEAEAGRDTLTIVKQLSFQDLRRQRLQEQQEKKPQRKQSHPLDLGSVTGERWTTPPGRDTDGQSSRGSVHRHSVPLPEGSPMGVGAVDVNRFLQDHYPDLHTFADEEFDPSSQDGSIQLPTIPFRVTPPDPGRMEQGQAGPSNGVHHPSRQAHYNTPHQQYHEDHRMGSHTHPQSSDATSYSFQQPVPVRRHTAGLSVPGHEAAMKRPSADDLLSLGTRRESASTSSHHHLTQSPHPMHSPWSLDRATTVPINRPVSSLDGYMHDRRQTLAMSHERGGHFDASGHVAYQDKYHYSQEPVHHHHQQHTPPSHSWTHPSPVQAPPFAPDGQYSHWGQRHDNFAQQQQHVNQHQHSYAPTHHQQQQQQVRSGHPDLVVRNISHRHSYADLRQFAPGPSFG